MIVEEGLYYCRWDEVKLFITYLVFRRALFYRNLLILITK